jgi:hypothetical protein
LNEGIVFNTVFRHAHGEINKNNLECYLKFKSKLVMSIATTLL